jgi:hypothetical protein
MILFLILLDEKEHTGQVKSPLEEFADQLAGSLNQVYGARRISEFFPEIENGTGLLHEWLRMMEKEHPGILEELSFDDFLNRFVFEQGKTGTVIKPFPGIGPLVADILDRYPWLRDSGGEINEIVKGLNRIVSVSTGTGADRIVLDLSEKGSVFFIRDDSVPEKRTLEQFLGVSVEAVRNRLYTRGIVSVVLEGKGDEHALFMGLLRGLLGNELSGQPGIYDLVRYRDLSGTFLVIERTPGGKITVANSYVPHPAGRAHEAVLQGHFRASRAVSTSS